MPPSPPRSAGAERTDPLGTAYDTWRTQEIALHGRRFGVWSKPGALAGGGIDGAAVLLAAVIEARPADRILDLNCGTGLAGAAAAALAPAGRVLLAAATVIDAPAAERTVAANGLSNAAVHLSIGTSHLPLTESVDLAMVRLPKGRLPTLQLIWDAWTALRPGGCLYLAGANDEGIQSAHRHAADLFGNLVTLTYRKGSRVGRAVKPDRPPALPDAFASELLDHGRFHQFTADVRGRRYQVCSRPGVFAWDRLDEGTRALIEAMDIRAGERVLDLGCGSGIAGAVAADLVGAGGRVVLVDVDLDALESARRTVAANGLTTCQVVPSDCAAAVRSRPFDVAITNPPFHRGNATGYDIAHQFIRDAAAVLAPGGRLYLVANRFIPYEGAIREAFGNVAAVSESPRYKVLMARRTERPSRRRAVTIGW